MCGKSRSRSALIGWGWITLNKKYWLLDQTVIWSLRDFSFKVFNQSVSKLVSFNPKNKFACSAAWDDKPKTTNFNIFPEYIRVLIYCLK